MNYLSSRNHQFNNFDFLRFLLALTVFLVHISFLSQSYALKIFELFLSSQVAVECFFVISGFLIFMSFENSSNIENYFIKRLRRIYPAYIAIISLTAFFIFIFHINTLNVNLMYSIFKYFIANAFFLNFLHSSVLGIFEDNHLQAINGALWTLKIEVMFYLLVPIIASFFNRFNKAFVLLFICFLSLSYSYFIQNLIALGDLNPSSQLKHQLPAQLVYFLVGAIFFYYFELFKRYIFVMMSIAIASTFFYFDNSLFWILRPWIFGIFVIAFATLVPCLGKFSKYGDISYGIYIIHFPIIQLCVSFGLFKNSAILGLIVSLILVLFLAFLLWHTIEKPFLSRSSHYLK
jgi:peptidoglycan/LPS O-acetylase OafA/YrhL